MQFLIYFGLRRRVCARERRSGARGLEEVGHGIGDVSAKVVDLVRVTGLVVGGPSIELIRRRALPLVEALDATEHANCKVRTGNSCNWHRSMVVECADSRDEVVGCCHGLLVVSTNSDDVFLGV